LCANTTITDDKQPDLKYIDCALTNVGKVLQKGQLVIVESTVFPGYCENIGKSILENLSGLTAGVDFYFAHCPERINPGDSNWNITNIPRVIGGVNEKSTKAATAFYSRITLGELHPVLNMTEAEASKIIENAFRDINIAFVNEMAQSFDEIDVNIYRVLEASASKPFGFMPFIPGMGVGGHCIPVDPYYLIASADKRNFTHSFLSLARDINDSMIDYVYKKIAVQIKETGLTNPRIGIFGLTYKPNVSDIRESQSVRLMKLLKSKGLAVKSYDPIVESDIELEDDLFEWANIVVVAVNHDLFVDFERKINLARNVSVVIDTAHMINPDSLKRASYRGIGL
jgi:nucleotide sugar dehydrogenase